MRLLWLDPIGTDTYREPTLRRLRAACRADTDIDFVSLPQGRPLDLEDPASEAIVAPDIAAIAGRANAAYDGMLASIRSAGLSVAQLGEHSRATLDALARAGRRAIEEDGADMLIVGCTADTASRGALESQLAVPVLDSVVAPFTWLERQVQARKTALVNI